jgi:curli biogenesis system outer membrane secretion channel CsgG
VTTLILKQSTPFTPRGFFSKRAAMFVLFAVAVALLAMFNVTAATTEGTALQGAYTTLDDLANGYGKQILTLMGFVIAAVGYFGANSSSAVFKFIGYAIFLGAALGAATTLVGAVV